MRVIRLIVLFLVVFGVLYGGSRVWEKRVAGEEGPMLPEPDASYSGVYGEAGVFGGKVYYRKAAPVRYLFWHEGLGAWVLGDVLDETVRPAYSAVGVDLPAKWWYCEGGAAPPPMASEVEVEPDPSGCETEGR